MQVTWDLGGKLRGCNSTVELRTPDCVHQGLSAGLALAALPTEPEPDPRCRAEAGSGERKNHFTHVAASATCAGLCWLWRVPRQHQPAINT